MKNLSRIFLLLILNFILLESGFNQPAIDSLKTELDKTHKIPKKIEIYLSLANAIHNKEINTAIEFTNKALFLAESIVADSLLGIIYSRLGEYSLLQDSIINSEYYFNKASEYIEKQNSPVDLISLYLSIGNRFIEKDNYAEAMKYYLMGIEICTQSGLSENLPNLYNNLGIVYLNTNNPEKALDLYSKALEIFILRNDTMNIAGTTTNIGSIYIRLEQNEIAGKYYLSGYELFKSHNSLEGMAHSRLKLGLLNIIESDYSNAIKNLEESLNLQKELEVTVSGSKSFFLAETLINLGIAYLYSNMEEKARLLLIEGYKIAEANHQYRLVAMASENLSSYYKKSGNYQKALDYYQVFKQFSDSSLNEESIRNLTQTELRHEFSARLKEEELQRKIQIQKEKRKNLIYIITSVGLFLLLVILGLLLRLEKTRKRRIELEKDGLRSKLEHTNKELTTYVMYLLRKNEFIISIAEKLKVARLDAKAENKKIMSDLIKELESNSTMISWEEFEVRFQQVYTGFYKKLNTSYPDLTPNELRLCAFFRLNMTTKEIAAITYQSINSISVARYRLRKKLGLNPEENLVAFLTKL